MTLNTPRIYLTASRCPPPPPFPVVPEIGDGVATVLSTGYIFNDTCELDSAVDQAVQPTGDLDGCGGMPMVKFARVRKSHRGFPPG